MKKALAWLLVLAMTAALAVGGTLAYLTDTDEDVNVMTVGKVRIDQLEYERVNTETTGDEAEVQEFHNNKPLYPAVTEDGWEDLDGSVNWDQIGKDGYTSDIWDPAKINNEVDKMVFVKNKGDWDAYVRTVFAFEAGSFDNLDDYLDKVHLNLNDSDWTWEWAETPVTIGEGTYFIATATYNKVLEPGVLTEISLSQIALDPSATNEDVEGFGETFQVLVQSQAVQADGFRTSADEVTNAQDALNEAFGQIIVDKGTVDAPQLEADEEELPFEDDNPVEGIDLKTALHNYEGNTSNVITTKVSNVVFGLNKDHTEIVDEYDGTLVDVEQDVPVYAYYVPNGGNYDVYFLANDVIYTPADSMSLFRGMTALKNIDSSNLDTGRTQKFAYFLRDCTALTSLDVSGWDVSNTGVANDMYGMFYGCTKLAELKGIEGWDVSNTVDMYSMFRKTSALTNLDLSSWTPKSVQTLGYMFRESGITSLDLSGWNMPALTTATQLTALCSKLQTLDLSGWKANNWTNATYMVYSCGKVKSVDTTGWDTASLNNSTCMFYNCSALEAVIGVEDWETGNLVKASNMFEGCKKLDNLDLTNWDMSGVEDTFNMFFDCQSLKNFDASTWKLTSLETATQMFMRCKSLEQLDVSGWGMDSAKTLYLMFSNCEKVQALDVSNWNTSTFEDLTGTFAHCYALTELDVGEWDTSSVTSMRGTFNACIGLEELDIADWDVRKVTDFRMMFQGADSNAMDMKIKKLDVSKWEPVSAVYMNHLFYGCAQLTEIDCSGWVMPNLYTTSHMFADCINLEVIDVSGWQTTSSWYSMDAMFNDCRSVKYLDVSCFNTSGVVEFSQIFESCRALEVIDGLTNWDTANGKSFEQTFLNTNSVKVLDLSSFDTRNATNGYKSLNNANHYGFGSMFSGVNSLEKLVLGENFSFVGDGTVRDVCVLPNPAGTGTKWYNAENDTYYAASEIQPLTAATYVAAVPPAQSEG